LIQPVHGAISIEVPSADVSWTVAGTLRVNVLDFDVLDVERQSGVGHSTLSAFDLLTHTRPVSETEALPNGTTISRYVEKADEDGEHLHFYKWQIGVRVSVTHFRIVVFTYTIVAGQERSPQMQDELKLLDRLIASGEYPALEGIAGDYVHKPAT